MKKTHIVAGFVFLYSLFSLIYADDDTLTSSQCDNINQIVARQNAIRIEYIMHGFELDIKTIKDYLNNNSFSKPYVKKYTSVRAGSFISFGVGLGLLVTNFALNKPLFHPMGLGGASLMVLSFPVYFKANEKFRQGIYHYNRSICEKKAF